MNLRKKIIACTLIALAALGSSFLLSSETASAASYNNAIYNNCWDANGTYRVNTDTYGPYSDFSEVGGTDASGSATGDRGVRWACNGAARATLFFAKAEKPYYPVGNLYVFNVNASVDPNSEQSPMAITGLTHQGGGIAVQISLCLKRNCSPSEHNYEIFGSRPRSIARNGRISNGWTVPNDYTVININGKKLYEKIKSNNHGGLAVQERNGYYIVTVYNYRCYNGVSDGACGVSPMYLTVRADQNATFSGSTTVNTTSLASTDGNYSVTFTHKVRRTSGNSFSVTNNCRTNVSNSGVLYPANKGGTGKNCTFDSYNVGDEKVTTDTITGYIYPGQTITICESMTYQSEVHTFETGQNKNATTERKCVTITRNEATCAGNHAYTHAGGTNIGRIGVKNTGNGKQAYTSYDGALNQEVSIFAKPGDSIQFAYDMCAGAELANKLNFNPKKYVSYAPSASSTSGNDSSYLFGTTVKTWTNSATSGFLGSSYELQAKSPENSGDDYKCDTYNQVTNRYTGSHYQIPGLTNSPNPQSNCYAATKTKNSDVGSIISQKLSWNALSITNRNRVTSNNNRTSTASVKIPYNYKIKVTANETDNNIRNVIAGTSLSLNMKLNVLTRKNSLVQTGAYSTHTKPTTYRIYQWYVAADTSINSIKSSLGTAITGGGGYYNRNDIGAGKTVIAKSDSQVSITDAISNISANINIDRNISIGTKVCIAASVFPADSHNNPSSADTGLLDQTQALTSNTAGAYYYISEPTCYTVSKKPSFAVKGSGLYAYAGAESSLMRRTIGNGENYDFNSWSEYSIVSSKNILGVGSGASYWGGTKESSVSGGRACYFSSLTIANESCRENKVGETLLSDSQASSPQSLKEQIMTRYVSSTNSAGKTLKDYKGKTIDLTGTCVYNSSSGRYEAPAGANFDCLSNGTKISYSSGNLTVSGGSTLTNYCMSAALTDYDSRTSVIYVKGTLTIDANFYYGEKLNNGTCLYHNQVYESMHKMPQQIIIANKVVFNQRVTNYDGWVIADTVETCNVSATDKNNGISANSCNQQLTFNGPVITRYLHLYRTYGGGSNSTVWSVYDNNNNNKGIVAAPAEIFNIGPETYLWSYQQATRYSQAFTTYQRELPVRY